MACDIHVIVERKSCSGKWVGVYSSAEYFARKLSPPWGPSTCSDRALDPGMLLRNHNYLLFAVLSGVRSCAAEAAEEFALHPGLPRDASAGVLHLISGDGDLHSHGYALLKDLLSFDPQLEWIGIEADAYRETPENLRSAALGNFRSWVANIRKIADDPPDHFYTALGDIERNPDTGEILAYSGHQVIKARSILNDLMPVSRQTVRVVVAYDN